MHGLARCSQVLYDKEMLDNAKQVHELRKIVKPKVTAKELHIATTLQWVLFEERYTQAVHTHCMGLPFNALLPPSLFETPSGFPMNGIMAGVNAVFRALSYIHYDPCRAELLLYIEHSFRNICYNCWWECLTVDETPFISVSTFYVRQKSHLTPKEILEWVL